MAQAENHNSTWGKAIRAAAQNGRLSHAVILTGEGDKVQAARYIAAAHLCRADSGRPCLQCNACRKVLDRIHPDVTEVQDSERKELPVETIRALRQDAYIRPNEGERKVYLFTDCAQLNERDQNVLLKIVEEGPPYAAFVFCADAVHALLPTIRSRCVELRMDATVCSSHFGKTRFSSRSIFEDIVQPMIESPSQSIFSFPPSRSFFIVFGMCRKRSGASFAVTGRPMPAYTASIRCSVVNPR